MWFILSFRLSVRLSSVCPSFCLSLSVRPSVCPSDSYPLFEGASHSRDTLWPWKFKAKGTPVSAASSPPISLVFHTRTSNRLLSLSLHDNRASHSRDTTWPWKVKVKCQVQMYPSQHSVQLTHFLSVLHQGIPSTSVPFVPWLSGLHFPRYNLTLKWKSKVKVKGTLVNV